ncbi:MAG: CdaR family protein [Chloroflexota bacterium]
MMRVISGLISNIALLILALIIAIMIWVNASQTEDPITNQFLQIPVEVVGRPENTIIQPSLDRQNVQIVFEGRASVVNQLRASDFTARVNLSEAELEADVTVPIEVTPKEADVSILTWSPEVVVINMEELVTEEIPVRLDVRGSVARGHRQGEPLIDPPFISVSGPASRVRPLNFARVTVFLNNDRETRVVTPQPIFYDNRGLVASNSGLDLSVEQVQVTIPVDESADFAEAFVTVDWQGQPASGYRVLSIQADPPTVLVQGSPTRLSLLSRINTEEIDVTGLTESFEQQVALVLPDGITLDQDQEIFVNIEIEPIVTTSIFNRPIEVQGLGEELEAILEPDGVRVFLFGPLPALDALLDEEIRVTADLFGLDVGTYPIEPDVDLPDQRGIELRSIQPSQISVTITRALTITDEITATEGITDTEGAIDLVPLDVRTAVSTTHADATLVMPDLSAHIADLPTLAYQSVQRKISLWDAVS